MIVACPSCHAQYRLDAARLRDGKGRLRCARCRTVFPGAAPIIALALAEKSVAISVSRLSASWVAVARLSPHGSLVAQPVDTGPRP